MKNKYYAIIGSCIEEIVGSTMNDGAFDIDKDDVVMQISKKDYDGLMDDNKEIENALNSRFKSGKGKIFRVEYKPTLVKKLMFNNMKRRNFIKNSLICAICAICAPILSILPERDYFWEVKCISHNFTMGSFFAKDDSAVKSLKPGDYLDVKLGTFNGKYKITSITKFYV